MHAVVVESLEEYLSGVLEPAAQRDIEAHLSSCQMCREEIHSMQDISLLFTSMRTEETWDPSPGFMAGVMRQVGEREAAPTFASFFSLDLAFGRRLVFASLMMLALLGGYLVNRETDYPVGPSPEAVMAQQDMPAFETAPPRDNMLVSLTAYEH